MSRWTDDEELDQRIQRGLIVQAFHPDDVTLQDYLAHTSRADPTEVQA
jgi:hypothetical protein